MYERRLSVSYDRLLNVSTDEANWVITSYKQEGVVCPTLLRDGLFTTGNLDHLEYRPQSCIYISSRLLSWDRYILHHVSSENTGTPRTYDMPDDGMSMLNKIKPLPDIYVNVSPATFPKKHPLPPKTDRWTSIE